MGKKKEDSKWSQDKIMYKDHGNVTVCDLGLVYAPPTSVCLPWFPTRVVLAMAGIQATVTLGTYPGGCSSPWCGLKAGLDSALTHTHATGLLSLSISVVTEVWPYAIPMSVLDQKYGVPVLWWVSFDQQGWKPEDPSCPFTPLGGRFGCSVTSQSLCKADL